MARLGQTFLLSLIVEGWAWKVQGPAQTGPSPFYFSLFCIIYIWEILEDLYEICYFILLKWIYVWCLAFDVLDLKIKKKTWIDCLPMPCCCNSCSYTLHIAFHQGQNQEICLGGATMWETILGSNVTNKKKKPRIF